MDRYTTSSFVAKARSVHGKTYIYSEVRYVHSCTKVVIKCRKHGRFTQLPYKHLNGHGCRRCATELRSKKQAATTAEFVAEARAIHGNRFDYSTANYSNRSRAVRIGCKEHGIFKQTPQTHLRGSKCPECSKQESAEKQRYSTEEFIFDAKQKHGERYDYSESVYEDCRIRVTIRCKKHGTFSQLPRRHVAGANCPKCATIERQVGRRDTREGFIRRATTVQKRLYDYSLVVYEGRQVPVLIVCPEHGGFLQTPAVHLQDKGCPECGKKSGGRLRTKTTFDFIQRARTVFGNRYDYRYVQYQGCQVPVEIICNEHGLFTQTPSCHLAEKGCPLCGDRQSQIKQTWTKEEFLEQAEARHGSRYDYSDVEYIHSQVKVTITCRRHHHRFAIPPNAHLRGGGGCRRCAAEKLSLLYQGSREEFIASAQAVHGDRYKYDLVHYSGCNTKVIILCQYHGEFLQTPSIHLNGSGCRKCNLLGGLNAALFDNYPEKRSLPAVLYLLRVKTRDGKESFLKIGITTTSVSKRFAQQRWYGHLALDSLLQFRTDLYSAWLVEQSVKLEFCEYRYSPARRFPGDTECLLISTLENVRNHIAAFLPH